MEIRNPNVTMTLTPDLQDLLQLVRNGRRFDAKTYLDAKALLLNRYLIKSRLSSVVVAVSGGIDSAVVLGIAAHAQRQPNSPIQRIVAITMPDRINDGVTGQDEAADLAKLVCESQGIEGFTLEMGGIVQSIMQQVEFSLGRPNEEKAQWCRGQATSYARTPTYYYVTSLLASQGTPGVVLGTTNLSEGGYLGYFGKASDGMVDVQMISDIYKSEVYRVAQLLNLPQEVINRAPTGDMYDATTDEVVFGAPYDYVEIFQETLRTGDQYFIYPDDASYRLSRAWDDNLEAMHNYNAHKYLGRSPAVHLDIMPCAIPGGWVNGIQGDAIQPPTISQTRRIRGPFDKCPGMDLMYFNDHYALNSTQALHPSIPMESAFKLNLLKKDEATRILNTLPDLNQWEAVGVDGRNYTHPEYVEGSAIGSYRASIFHPTFAKELWNRVRGALPSIRITSDYTATTTGDNRIWKPVGVADLMRVIRYEPGGKLIPHYDLTHKFDPNRRTLMSLVINLTDEEGATNFLHEPQTGLPYEYWDLSDWARPSRPEEQIVSVQPQVGQALVFDHGLLHEGAPVLNSSKVVIRTDIIFERAEWFD